MSNTNATTGPLPRAEQALRALERSEHALHVLERSEHSAELLSEYYAGSKFEPSIAIVIDMIRLAISLVEAIQFNTRIDIKSLAATAVKLVQRFGKFTPYRQQTALLLIVQLIALGAEEK